jgi:acyl-CoA synthetase (AMP-forming)/AMP-acid ligase II
LTAVVTGAFETTLDLFDVVVERAGTREAVVDGDHRLTFAEWARAGDGVAAWLWEQGVRKGDVVAIRVPSGADFAIAYQGIMRAGAIASGLNTRLGPSEVAYIMERAAPTFVFDDAGVIEAAAVTEPRRPRPDLAAADPVAIVWTSGTTGHPKGAVFDHGCLRAMATAAGPLTAPCDRKINPLPFAHIGYMTRLWDDLANLVTQVVVPTPWTAGTALELLESERITVGQGVPAQWELMLAHPHFDEVDTSSLRIVSTGAARVPPELVRALRERLGCPVVVRYASTEASVATGTDLGDPDDVVATTVGRPGAGVELRITDDDGRVLASGDVGTVNLRGRAMMRGYWKDPERTAEAVSTDGWLVTGDQGYVGGDGNLRLVGRRTEMYIRNGYNVYPGEVESCLGAHPGVERVAIVGGGPVPVQGEIGVAFVVPRAGADPELAVLRTFVRERLADYKAPDVLVLVDELPLTSMSKVDKRVLQARANEAAAAWRR